MEALFKVENLRVQFSTRVGTLHAVNGVSFQIKDGETLGVVGESGCGKSVSMLSTLKLISEPPAEVKADRIVFQQQDITTTTHEEIRRLRGSQIGLVFQDPIKSLNPVMTIGQQVAEPLIIHKNMKAKEALSIAAEGLEMVGIPNPRQRLADYPHQFSGGMRQRVMIAMALICRPQLLIADEPTTALDVTIQAQVIDVVKRLRDKLGMAIIWITHDLGIIAGLADRVSVMYGGRIVEEALVEDLYYDPLHPYTVGLLNSLPKVEVINRHRLFSIKGLPSVLYEAPNHCSFSSRCMYVHERCLNELPTLKMVAPGHQVACWLEFKSLRNG